MSSKEHYLSRALGADYRIEIDYRNIELKEKDIFLLMTDGVYEFVTDQQLLDLTLIDADLNQLAKAVCCKIGKISSRFKGFSWRCSH